MSIFVDRLLSVSGWMAGLGVGLVFLTFGLAFSAVSAVAVYGWCLEQLKPRGDES